MISRASCLTIVDNYRLLEPGEQRALLVTAVGFANELYPVPDPPPQRVEIMLVRDAVIAGIVLNEAGEPAGAGIHVLAYRYSTSQPTPAVVVAAMNGEETECHAALTGVDGAYELHGLKPDRKYGLLCGGNGRMLRFDGFPTEIVQAGTTDATLIVHPLYGALVRFVDQFGAPVRPPPRSGGWSAWSEYGDAQSVLNSSRSAILAGIDPILVDQEDPLLFMTTTDELVPAIGPNVIDTKFVGYKPTRVSYDAGFVGNGITKVEALVERRALGWGQLSVRFANLVPGTTVYPQGNVSLHSADEHFELGVPRTSVDHQVYPQVPIGTYEAVFKAMQGTFRFPPTGTLAVTISETEDATMVIDLGGTGALNFVLNDEQSEYVDVVSGLIAPGVPVWKEGREVLSGGGGFGFARKPYLVTGLLPGTYTVRMHRPVFHASLSGELVHVEAGIVTTVTFDLPELAKAGNTVSR